MREREKKGKEKESIGWKKIEMGKREKEKCDKRRGEKRGR